MVLATARFAQPATYACFRTQINLLEKGQFNIKPGNINIKAQRNEFFWNCTREVKLVKETPETFPEILTYRRPSCSGI